MCGPDPGHGTGLEPRSLWAAYLRGALTNLTNLTNLLNPTVGVFSIALMGFAVVIFATEVARRWLTSPPVVRAIDRITGGILIAFGAVRVPESRPKCSGGSRPVKGCLQKLHVDARVREPDGPRIRAALFADGFHQITNVSE